MFGFLGFEVFNPPPSPPANIISGILENS